MMFEAENLLRISDNTMKMTKAVKNTPPTVNPTDDHDYEIKDTMYVTYISLYIQVQPIGFIP